MSTLSSTATTPRSSIELTKSAFKVHTTSIAPLSIHTTQSKPNKIWQSVKRHVRQHHESVNAVYANYYGQGHERRVMLGSDGVRRFDGQDKAQEVWVYERGMYGR
ncbi:hypothetical protein BU25DRAFT_409314 [Macroventuria anomochaeta]|uniref:Uncharacterized protein n=1 Tax=Macroventuria anomochaeta TaxID=301207 RepID=A0ACB6S609_9PLEO|nr:uncharacterized protein BU25DRAFT_409314 [Macroventuria anomochaeta]KAF2629432.1 hypothetical protein BU25DRAFT_409314 [Macroventuria anomochaeta]